MNATVKRTSTAMYFGLDIFNAYCCDLRIENNVDKKRMEHDMYAVDGGIHTVSLKYIDRFVCVCTTLVQTFWPSIARTTSTVLHCFATVTKSSCTVAQYN